MIPIKKRIEVIVSGEIQAVGYREFVRKATFRRMITGFVQNLEDRKVKIVAEGSEEELKNFLSVINVSEYPIDVTGMDIKWDIASKNFNNFEIIRGDKDSELFERIDVAGTMLYKLLDNSSTSLVKQDQMLNKQDIMIEKQDQMLNKQDIMIDLQVDTKDEIKNMRGDLGNSIIIEFAEIRRKLQSIEDALGKIGVKVE